MGPRERILLVVTECLLRQTRQICSRKRQRILGGACLVQAVKPERISAGQLVINSTEGLLVGRGSGRRNRNHPGGVKNIKLIHQLNRELVEICRWNNSAWEQRSVGSIRRTRCIRTERRVAVAR